MVKTETMSKFRGNVRTKKKKKSLDLNQKPKIYNPLMEISWIRAQGKTIAVFTWESIPTRQVLTHRDTGTISVGPPLTVCIGPSYIQIA